MMFDRLNKGKGIYADYTLLESICCRDCNEKITVFDGGEGTYKFYPLATVARA